MSMNRLSQSFIDFSKKRMEIQGALIQKWVNDPDPELAQCCRDILEASGVVK